MDELFGLVFAVEMLFLDVCIVRERSQLCVAHAMAACLVCLSAAGWRKLLQLYLLFTWLFIASKVIKLSHLQGVDL